MIRTGIVFSSFSQLKLSQAKPYRVKPRKKVLKFPFIETTQRLILRGGHCLNGENGEGEKACECGHVKLGLRCSP
jgi:hypothetical protein